jgi:hypothetical protein
VKGADVEIDPAVVVDVAPRRPVPGDTGEMRKKTSLLAYVPKHKRRLSKNWSK